MVQVAPHCRALKEPRGNQVCRNCGRWACAGTRAHLREDADGAGDAKEDGVEVLLLDAVVLQQHAAVRIHVGPWVFHLRAAFDMLLISLAARLARGGINTEHCAHG